MDKSWNIMKMYVKRSSLTDKKFLSIFLQAGKWPNFFHTFPRSVGILDNCLLVLCKILGVRFNLIVSGYGYWIMALVELTKQAEKMKSADTPWNGVSEALTHHEMVFFFSAHMPKQWIFRQLYTTSKALVHSLVCLSEHFEA